MAEMEDRLLVKWIRDEVAKLKSRQAQDWLALLGHTARLESLERRMDALEKRSEWRQGPRVYAQSGAVITGPPDICSHGSLARQCHVCELETELREAKDQLATVRELRAGDNTALIQLRNENARLRAEIDGECAGNCDSALRQLVAMTAERDALTVALATCETERHDWKMLAEHRAEMVHAVDAQLAALAAKLERVTQLWERSSELGDLARQRAEDAESERDAARDLLTDAEHTRDMALSRVDEVENEREGAFGRVQELEGARDYWGRAYWGLRDYLEKLMKVPPVPEEAPGAPGRCPRCHVGDEGHLCTTNMRVEP